jgi:hypothetical protein
MAFLLMLSMWIMPTSGSTTGLLNEETLAQEGGAESSGADTVDDNDDDDALLLADETNGPDKAGYTEGATSVDGAGYTGAAEDTWGAGQMYAGLETGVEDTNLMRNIERVASGYGSIAGFLWADNSGSLTDEIYNRVEQPLADYTVYLFAADYLEQAIAETSSDADGAYIFENLAPGSYVLGLAFSTENCAGYQLAAVQELKNKFTLDSASEPPMAYTDVIELEDEQAVEEINAVLRLKIEDDAAGQLDGDKSSLEKENNSRPVIKDALEEDALEEDILDMASAMAAAGAPGSISGLVWADGDGTKITDWDGLINGAEQPLPDITVTLFAAADLFSPLAAEVTDAYGIYMFDNLEEGDYVLMISEDSTHAVQYALPEKITADNKFKIDLGANPLAAFTGIISLETGQSIMDINAGLLLPKPPPLGIHTIDFSTVVNNTNGPGWSYTVTSGTHPNTGVGTVTFYGNHATYGSASNREYTIIKSLSSNMSERHIVVEATANNVTIKYDGPNIKVNSGPTNYFTLMSNVTIKGGYKNSVIYDRVETVNSCIFTIDNGATNTSVTYLGGNQNKLDSTYLNNSKLDNSGANTSITYDGFTAKYIVINNKRSGAANAASMYFKGTNTFNTVFQVNNTNGAYLNLLLAGTATVANGYFDIAGSASLTIDSAAASGSDNGNLIMTRNTANGANAVIGSSGNSGAIIIKGGTLNITQSGGYGAAIGGGKDGEGNVTILGGKITASAYGGGATIGSGYGGNVSGNVTINGGVINATNTGTGAVIGGGYEGIGNVTINGGTIDATTGATTGAGIGGGTSMSSSNRSGEGNVTITGGNITVYSNAGAGIGGGGTATGSAVGYGYVDISGGNIKVSSMLGACIGNGGCANIINTAPQNIGSVKITGGTLFLEMGMSGSLFGGNGIGTGQHSKVIPYINIEPGADIVAFAKHTTNFPGFDGGDNSPAYGGGYNLGKGYFVNMNFDTAKGAADGLAIIYKASNPSIPFKWYKIPYAFTTLSFATGSTGPEDFIVYTGTFSGGLKQIVRTLDNQGELYSVNRTFDYYYNGHSITGHFRSLSVKYGANAVARYAIKEKYVDIYGKPIPGAPEETYDLAQGNGIYAKTVPTILKYTAKGFKWDNPPNNTGSDFTASTLVNEPISGPRIIYFVYELRPQVADVTVSKILTGKFANMTKSFTFTLRLTDNGGNPTGLGKTYSYVGDVLPNTGASPPPNGALTLDYQGEAQFSLSHGQTINIKNLPADAKVQIIEDVGDSYEVLINGSAGQSLPEGTGTGPLPLDSGNPVINFVNDYMTAPPEGIEDDIWMVKSILLSVMISIVLGLATIGIWRKVKCAGSRQ